MLFRSGRALAGSASEYGEVQLPANAEQVFSEASELAACAAQRLRDVADVADRLDS